MQSERIYTVTSCYSLKHSHMFNRIHIFWLLVNYLPRGRHTCIHTHILSIVSSLLAGLLLQGCVFAALMRPLTARRRTTKAKNKQESEKAVSADDKLLADTEGKETSPPPVKRSVYVI